VATFVIFHHFPGLNFSLVKHHSASLKQHRRACEFPSFWQPPLKIIFLNRLSQSHWVEFNLHSVINLRGVTTVLLCRALVRHIICSKTPKPLWRRKSYGDMWVMRHHQVLGNFKQKIRRTDVVLHIRTVITLLSSFLILNYQPYFYKSHFKHQWKWMKICYMSLP